jgi:hypothetical protein
MTGILGQAYISTINTDILVYQVSANTTASFTVNICNRSGVNCNISIAVTQSGLSAPDNPAYIEDSTTVYPSESFVKPGLVLSGQQKLWVKVSVAGVSVNVFGFEQ